MKIVEHHDAQARNTQLEDNSFNRFVTRGQETLSRMRSSITENPTYIRFSKRCAQVSNILYHILGICFFLCVHIGGRALLLGLFYIKMVMQQTITVQDFLNAFGLNNFTYGR
ncbi:MAG: hypothetical protein C5B43_03680 [Verrucomicrobia bacterium]|nr:MAG: hypothetical protein C5B43_03680 [Verrucomicrobiota bacterium]